MDLKAWNHRLADHFAVLAHDRKDIPLFALEHGLAEAELREMQDQLRAHIRTTAPTLDHQLVWTVYAAEIGYGYAGDEYWQTFEEKTPGWTQNATRRWIRSAFVAFQRKFAGARPSGAWAEHFSIIAWPITHAILPRDLQQQLARVLYDLRHSFSAELFEEPNRLGDFIAARSWNASARFQNLVQAPALVGQIAAALLLQGREGFKPLLHPMTLKRIGDDLDRERRGRDWLRGARHAAEERARIRGLAIEGPTTPTFRRREEARAEIERLGIEPRVVLRPLGGVRWEVSLEIPELTHLLLRFPQVRDILTQSRCTVTGAAGRPLARSSCLHRSQRVVLERWPRQDEVLLEFEQSDVQLEYLLRAECMLRPGTSWLFKVASDGLAYETRGMRVRAGSRYLLLSTEPLIRSTLSKPVELTCQGLHGVLLDVPAALTAQWEQVLKDFQVSQAKIIEVWPVGLAAVMWDGEGYGEWVASETPTLAISSDHAIDEVTICMEKGEPLSLDLTGTPPGEPLFIELPPLAVGRHKFAVGARAGSGARAEVLATLEVVIRKTRPWSPDLAAQGPFDVELDPAAPSLEQFWEGRADVLVRGPRGRRAKCRLRMFARADETPIYERHLPPLPLPLPTEDWTRYVETNLKSDKRAQQAYDDTHICELEFSADELGVFTLRCEREFTPLRWAIRRDSAGYVVRLHNDADSSAPVVERFSFERPNIGETLPTSPEYRPTRAGGLYVATVGAYRAVIIVPPIVRDIADLKCHPRVDVGSRSAEAITKLLTLAELWGKARLPGDLIAGAHRGTVLRALTSQILMQLGGRTWAYAESHLMDERGLFDLQRNISHRGHERELGSQLHVHYPTLAGEPPTRRVATLASLAERVQLVPRSPYQREIVGTSRAPVGRRRRAQGVGPEYSEWLAEFALRMASAPMTLSEWAGEHVDAGVRRLLDVPALARAARFLVLAVNLKMKPLAALSDVYAGWEWSP